MVVSCKLVGANREGIVNEQVQRYWLKTTIKLDETAGAAFIMELRFQGGGGDGLALWERGERTRQCDEGRDQDQAEVNRQDEARIGFEPVLLLQTYKNQRGHDHDRRSVDDARHGCFGDRERGHSLRFAQRFWLFSRSLAFLSLFRVLVRKDVDAPADLLGPHQKHIQHPCTGYCCKRHQSP